MSTENRLVHHATGQELEPKAVAEDATELEQFALDHASLNQYLSFFSRRRVFARRLRL